MEILRKLPLLLGVLLAAGCGFQREPTPIELTGEQLMVHSMLEAGSETVSVLLTRLDPRTALLDRGSRPLSGADVRILNGADTVRLAEAAAGFSACLTDASSRDGGPSTAGPGCYAALFPGGIRAGSRYGLLVTLPGGGVIRGEAVVPDTVALLRPAPGTRVDMPAPQNQFAPPVSRIPVQWEGRDQAGWTGGMSLGLREAGIYREDERVSEGICNLPVQLGSFFTAQLADTLSIPVPYAYCFTNSGNTQREIPWDSLQVRLLVTAYDSAYVRYRSAHRDRMVEINQAAVGVTGALGLFAGSATAERRIVLVARR